MKTKKQPPKKHITINHGKASGDYKIWTCKLVINASEILPRAFDSPPRQAVESVMIRHGIDVVANFTGWGGKLTKIERDIIEGK